MSNKQDFERNASYEKSGVRKEKKLEESQVLFFRI